LPDIFKKYYRQYIDRFVNPKTITKIPFDYKPNLKVDNEEDIRKWRRFINLAYATRLDREQRRKYSQERDRIKKKLDR